MKSRRFMLVLSFVLLISYTTMAFPLTITVGDNDGYGFGIPDNGTAPNPTWGYDGRSTAEAAATNGAQITDVYSAIFPGYGPNPSQTASVIFPLGGLHLTSATLTVDMGDFEASTYGPISVNFNGVLQGWAFQDGYTYTVVRTFVLGPAEIAAANLAGAFIINLDHTGSMDFIAFDYFELNADVAPLPGAVLLLGTGLLGLVGLRIKLKK
ncbi:MAG: PEP-CTERM sorting domain-containing protein [Deltaproteobacteria bacterium]|nr:PEP-CTERM sorting domain-containing protein [Deltaproteobacteria bacterium]